MDESKTARAALGTGLVGVVLYAIFPGSRDVLYPVVLMLGFLGVWTAVVRTHGTARTVWALLATGATLHALVDVGWVVVTGTPDGPTPVNPLILVYVAGSVAYAAAGFVVVRRPAPGDRVSLVDALIITVAAGTLGWAALAGQMATVGTELTEQLATIVFPLSDLLAVVVFVRLVLCAGARATSLKLVFVAFTAMLLGDALWVIQSFSAWSTPVPVEVAWMLEAVLLGVAALHPSRADWVTPAAYEPVEEPGSPRLALVNGALIVGVTAVAVGALAGPTPDLWIAITGGALLLALVLVRMHLLVNALNTASDAHRRAAERERILRRAGTVLVGIRDRTTIIATVLDAARRVSGGDAMIVAPSRPADDELADIVRAWSQPEPPVDIDDLPVEARASLRAGNPLSLSAATLANGHVERNAATQVTADVTVDVTDRDASYLVVPLLARGEIAAIVEVATPLPLDDEVRRSLRVLASQVSLALERLLLTEALHLRALDARFRALVQTASDVITIVDLDGTVHFASPAVSVMLGWEADEIEGHPFTDLVHPEDRDVVVRFLDAALTQQGATRPVVFRMRHRSHTWRNVETIGNNLLDDPNVGGFALTTRDVTERVHLEQQLRHQAFHDALTGLANRALFADRVGHALSSRRPRQDRLAVLLLDLDEFKTVNDGLGHAAGDQMLVEIGERLRTCVRAGDTVARFGGDEFAVLLERVRDADEAIEVADRVLDHLSRPVTIGDRKLSISASIGIAIETIEHADPDVLIRDADAAMYAAKRQGRNRHRLFEPSMHARAAERLELGGDLQSAAEHGELSILLQPVVRLQDGAILGAEALLRWQHPRRGLLLPNEFIGLAEETGLIVPIGRMVLREACRQAASWPSPHHGQAPMVAVNVSARQLAEDSFVDEVAHAIAEHALDPRRLMLELTESLVMSDEHAGIDRLRELDRLGVRIAIDDFGTGYSSIGYLGQLPIHAIKIDQTFVAALGQDPDMRLVGAIIDLAHSMGSTTIAEGIEHPEQAARLIQLGCDHGQGWHYGRPMSTEAFASLLDYPQAASA